MKTIKNFNIALIFLISSTLLISCGGKFPGADARKYSKNPEDRIKKNMEEGRGFRFADVAKSGGGVFEFASSNELWRASLDTIDFMPLSSVNYSGGIIITDWYSTDQNSNESIKISIRFLTKFSTPPVGRTLFCGILTEARQWGITTSYASRA